MKISANTLRIISLVYITFWLVNYFAFENGLLYFFYLESITTYWVLASIFSTLLIIMFIIDANSEGLISDVYIPEKVIAIFAHLILPSILGLALTESIGFTILFGFLTFIGGFFFGALLSKSLT